MFKIDNVILYGPYYTMNACLRDALMRIPKIDLVSSNNTTVVNINVFIYDNLIDHKVPRSQPIGTKTRANFFSSLICLSLENVQYKCTTLH